jgi:hypothetical protein
MVVESAARQRHSDRQPNAIIPKFEVANGSLYGASAVDIRAFNQYNARRANYVTSSHAFGGPPAHGARGTSNTTTQNQLWSFFNSRPVSITQYARPLEDYQKLKTALGLYAQDRWTIRRITLNLGLRFDYHNAYVPALSIPALQFVPADYGRRRIRRHGRTFRRVPALPGICSPTADGDSRELRQRGQRVRRHDDGEQPCQH